MKFFLRVWNWTNGIAQAHQNLLANKHRHDVLEMALATIEEDIAITNVGYGGYPNLLGEVELDAAFMDGNNRMLGAIAAIKNFANPSSIARRLMEEGLHTMICGTGAEIFAREHDFKPTSVLTPSMQSRWQKEVSPVLSASDGKSMLDTVRNLVTPEENSIKSTTHDTVAMIVSDGNGISTATSTSGWPGKHPGRIGDSAISGAGFYADSRFGACVCTWTGEMSMRAGTARYVVAQLEAGKSVHDAVTAAIEDVSRLRLGVIAGLVIHALDSKGNARVVAIDTYEETKYWYWREDLPEPQCLIAEPVTIRN